LEKGDKGPGGDEPEPQAVMPRWEKKKKQRGKTKRALSYKGRKVRCQGKAGLA